MKVPTNTQQGNYSFSGDSDGKESACNAEALAWIPGLGRSLGEGNGYHSSILAWRIPWTEEPVRLQSMGSQTPWLGVGVCSELDN